jgi:hypothetical protein
MARQRSVDFLPAIFQTPVNKQFLAATLDTMVQEPKFKKTQGFIGRTVGPGVNPKDSYVVEPDKIRQEYQLEPGVVILEPGTKKVKDAITYPGINDAIEFQGGDSSRPDLLYQSDYYTWDPFVNYDAFINFSQYYWLPSGPDVVSVAALGVPSEYNFTVTREDGVYSFSGQAGTNPVLDLVRGGSYTFQVAQNTKETENFRVTNVGTTSYQIDFQSNPTLVLVRGNTYVFNLNLNGDYPFWIKTQLSLGTGDAYNSGVSRNGSAFGLVTFVVPQDAPDTLYYVSQNQTNLRGTINIIDGTPGTGPGFFIQTNPGVDGKVAATPNISARDVLGVSNNGEDLGTVTFEVPLKNAQQFYYTLPDVGPIDLMTDLRFDQINNKPLQQFIIDNNGIDGTTYLTSRTLVFINPTLDAEAGGWLQTTLFDPLDRLDSLNGQAGSFDTVEFDQATAIPFNNRYQRWQINIVNRQGVDYISLANIGNINVNEKFTVAYGNQYSNTSWYKGGSGYFEQIPLLTATLDTLYYQDGTDPEMFGRIRLLDQTQIDTIFIDQILGQPSYTAPNGVEFTNGLKVKFTGQVEPASYGSGNTSIIYTATISGGNLITCNSTAGLYVGQPIVFTGTTLGGIVAGQTYYIDILTANGLQFAIALQPGGARVQLTTATSAGFSAVAISDKQYYVSGVGTAIELLPVTDFVCPETYIVDANDSTIATEPGEIDYITINRASKDLNAWTRSNRWFHLEVIQATAQYNNTVAQLDNQYRAKRPIVEFRPGIRLFNMGTESKAPVDIVDFEETDALSNIEGSTGYTVDGVTFVDGTRVIFAADTDPEVRNKIYQVQLISPDTSPPMGAPYAGPQPIIHLVPATDAEVLVDQSVVCLEGTTSKGLSFWYNGSAWTLAQQKTSVQQPPLFDVYNLDGVSFANINTYPSTTFTGSKLFSYAIGDSGILDPILQFPLQYLNINNIGDIVFDNNLFTDTFVYVIDNVSEMLAISTGTPREYASRASFQRLLGWKSAVATSQVYQQFKFFFPQQTLQLDISVATSLGNNTAQASHVTLPALKVYVGSEFIQATDYTFTTTANSTTIQLPRTYAPTDIIEVLALSDQTSSVAFYQVPGNLQSNPLNGNSPSFTLGTIRTHYESICENLVDLLGPVAGSNNSRDLGDISRFGLVILQQSSPLTLAGYFLRSEKFNIFASLQYNMQEYLKFKGQMLNAVTQQTIQYQTTAQVLDTAVADITLGRVSTQPFYWSDMLPSGSLYSTLTYEITNTSSNTFDVASVYNYATANYQGMNVYLNNVILTRDQDYVVATDGPRITVLVTLALNDVLTINEYTATYGSFVPNTPTKLGLYPAYQPEQVEQVTSTGTQSVIIGHDGSVTRAFNDIRDAVLLEFETRIYNNLKLDGNPVPINLVDVVPGQFRTTGYSVAEVDNILDKDFLSYVAWNKLDYRTQNYRATNEFTWNYSGSKNRFNDQPLPGGWRGIYRYFYDTEQPQLTPWQMLGFSVKPTWWDIVYGAGPYTQDNLVLWDDLEAGYVADPVAPYYLPAYARSGLTTVIPTSDEGTLLSPFDSVVGNYNDQTFRKSWALGDGGPVEASWYNSSAYPFAAMRLLALTQPAKFFALFADRDEYRYQAEFGQYLYNFRYRLDANGVQVYGNGTSKASYINWIVDYNRNSGLDTTAELTSDLASLDVRLCYRMASFSDKQYIKIYTEKSSPNSDNSTFLIPDESYDLLLYKNQPFARASYSSVVIQQVSGGYAVYGYSTTQPYFNILTSVNAGQLQTFTSGGVSVSVPTSYTNTVAQIPYGYIFSNQTAVTDFLLSYGQYLDRQGLVFDDTTNGYMLSWGQMVNEFLYWSEQGWDDNALINLNPLAFRLSVTRPQAIVDSIVAQTSENILLDQNRNELPTRNLLITRLDNTFTIEPVTDQTLSYIDLKYTAYEHLIVLNNASSFGDLIYSPITGARQSRLNLIAATSTEWNGSVDAQGFILNQNNVTQWDSARTYAKGEIVLYKGTYWSAAQIVQPSILFNANDWFQSDYTQIELGLLPNLANKADQLQNSYNINTANLEQDNDLLSYGLIGFRPRQYLTSLNLDDVSQVNIYKQYLGTKGTILSAELLAQANLGKEIADYNIYENWAVQRAVYGANANRSFFQLRLNRALLNSNPSLVQVIAAGQPSQADQPILLADVWRQSYKLTSPNILPVTTTLPTDIGFPTAGYVNLQDADITVFDITDIASLAANIDQIQAGSTVWVAKTNQYDWNVFRAEAVPGTVQHVCDNLDGTSLVLFSQQHGLTPGQTLIIKQFDAEVNGVYTVIAVPNLTKVTIAFSFTGDRTIVDGTGLAFTLQTQRVAQASDIINLAYANTIEPGAKVWVDNNGNDRWAVLQKQEVFSSISELAPTVTDVGEQYSSSVAQANKRFAAIVGSPRYRFPVGATEWSEAEQYLPGDIVFVLDPYETQFYLCFSQTPTQPGEPAQPPSNTSFWTSYSLATLPRKGGIYVYVKTDAVDYTVASPLSPLDAVITLNGTGVLGLGSSVAFGNQDWAVSGAPNSLGSVGQADNGYACVIYRDAELAAPGSIPYGAWQLLTTPDSVSVDQGQFGSSVTVSQDERWLYIGAPGVNRVYAYGRVDWQKQFVRIFADGATTEYFIGDVIQIDAATQLQIGVGGVIQILNTDYTVNNDFNTVTFFTAPAADEQIEIQRINRKILDFDVYYEVPASGGTGTGATFVVTRLRNTVAVSVFAGGAGYADGNPSAGTLTILAAAFGGTANITLDVEVVGGTVTAVVGAPTYTPPSLTNTFSLNEFFFTVDVIDSFSVLVNDVLQRPNIDYTFNALTSDVTFLPTTAGNFGLGIKYTIITVGTTDFTAIGAISNTPGITFTATGAGTGTGTAQNPATGTEILVRAEGYFEYCDTISYAGSTAGDKFGSAVSTSTDGRQVLIAAENCQVAGTIATTSSSGLAAVGTNTYINLAQNSTSGLGQGARFTVTKQNSTYTVTVTAPGQDYAAGDTITILGSVLGGSVLYNNLTITVSSVESYANAGSVYVFNRNVQEFIYGTDTSSVDFTVLGTPVSPVSVSVNGTFFLNAAAAAPNATNTFTVSGSIVTINGDLQTGDIIQIETNQFAQTQIIQQNTVEEFANFGQALDLCSYDCSLYVGAPQSSIQVIKGGVVERTVNQSRAYGVITSTVGNPTLTSGDTINVDNIEVAVPSGVNQNVTGLAAAINAAVPNCNATVDNSGRLTLAVKNSAAAPVGDKLQVAPGAVGTAFADLGFDTYAFTQTILSPNPQEFASFGASVSLDESAVALIVGAPQGTLYLVVLFDLGETVFDDDVTEFFDQILQSGSVYTYDLLTSDSNTLSNPDKFVFGQQIQNSNVASYDQFGSAVDYRSGLLWAGAPGNELGDSTLGGNYGRVFISENANRLPAWTVLREQQPVVDVKLINSVYAYDRLTSATAAYFDFFNPLQGKILGAAKQNLDYIGAIDPAGYNVGPSNITGSSWQAANVGETWWDTSTVRFIDPNQDDILYASRRWGQIFPGSSVDVYQWVKSAVPPADYVGPGTPRNTSNYTVNTTLTRAGVFIPEYYFWVRGITTTAPGKTLPISTVANYITDPRASGIAYIAPLNASTFAIYNALDIISAEDTIISIEFDREYTDSAVHAEYELIAQDQADGFLSDNLYRKLLDSFCGVDISGSLVPDINLSVAQRYGVQFRPRQSMFVDRFNALENYLQRCNTVCARYPIAESRALTLLLSQEPQPSATSGLWDKRVANLEVLGFQNINAVPLGYRYLVDTDSNNRGLWTIYTVQLIAQTSSERQLTLTRVQNFDTRQYWSYINWVRPGYNISSQVIAEVPNFAGLNTTTAPVGSSVRVTANAQGKFEVYLRTTIGWDRVVLQDGTIEFSAQLYDYALGRFGFDNEVFDAQYFDQEPVIETRKVLQAINQEIFIDELLIERNRALTLMFNYVLSEFAAPEWLIKTSLVDVEHRIRSLLPFQNFSKDNQEFVLDYIQEVKPYHVQIRTFNLLYDGSDQWPGDISDFDVPAYFNTDLDVPQYTSPILLPYEAGTAFNSELNILSNLPSNSTVWDTWPYSSWYNTYLMTIDTIDVIETGSGYTEPPLVIITANSGDPAPTTPAQAVALLNSLGQVYAINVTDAGAGYRSTPTVSFDGGNGSGAVAYARLINGLTRSFKTVIRYDRYQYNSSITDWNGSTLYVNGTLVRYDDRVWAASSADGSSAVTGPNFDLENWTLVNASTYTYPGASQPTGLSGIDRTRGLYVAAANSPGLELPLLIDGIDYPGVQVYGNYFLGSSSTDPTINCSATSAQGNIITCAGTLPLQVGATIKFSGVTFGGIVTGTTYFVTSIPSSNTFTVTTIQGGINTPLTTATGSMTAQTLPLLDAQYESAFLDSYLGTQPSDIIVDGGEFIGPYEAHAPEELVNGSEFDTLDLRVYTRPGSDWQNDGHGFQVVSVRYTYDPAETNFYSWANVVDFPVQVLVSNLTTGQDLIENTQYFVDWAARYIVITSSVTPGDIININVYEAGGGSQLYRKNYTGAELDLLDNKVVVPVSLAQIAQVAVFVNGTIIQQIPVVTAYSDSVPWVITSEFPALSVIYNNNVITCTGTAGGGFNVLICTDTTTLTAGQPIVFSGTVFGGIVAGVEYYVLTVANTTQFFITAVSGSTTPVTLTTASGSMTGQPAGAYYRATQAVPAGIQLTNTVYWLPFVPSQRSEVFIPATLGPADLVSILILGDALSIPVTDVVSESNAVILLGDLSTLSVGQTVTFSGYSLGGIETSVNYQIFGVVSDSINAITLTLDGVTEVDLIDDQAAWSGELIAKFIPVDLASWSTPVVEQFDAVDSVLVTNSVTLSVPIIGTNAANMVVEINGLRQQPAEGIEWIGDDSSVSFGLPQRGNYSQSIISPPSDVVVWVDNVFQVQSVGGSVGTYSVTNYPGSNTPGRQVVFNTPPAAGARILITVSTIADYNVIGNTIQFNNLLNFQDRITVVTWNDTLQQNALSLVFVGPITTGLTVEESYDSTTYDVGLVDFQPGSFDYSVGTSIPVNNFDLLREGISANRLWVTLDGLRLFEGSDYTISGQFLILATGAIGANQVMVITEFSNSVVPDAVSFGIFQDMRGVQVTYRITAATTTTLTQPLLATADVIYVQDATKLTTPNLSTGVFGIITINGERISYRNINFANNTLTGLRRGTAGTAAADHAVTSEVYDLGLGNLLDERYQNYTVSDSVLADGSSSLYYAPSIDISDFGDSSSAYVESIEVYVGGARQYNYSETQSTSQYRYIVTDFAPLAIEFIVDNDPETPLLPPAAGSEVTILQRRALGWYQPGNGSPSDGVALQETDTEAARFLCDR